jgi:hypothetical protein
MTLNDLTSVAETENRPEFGPEFAAALSDELEAMPLSGRILRIAALGRAVFTTSLGLEDQVLTSLIAETGADMRIVTLDTGRLFGETEALIGETEARYGLDIEVFKPWKEDVDGLSRSTVSTGFTTASRRGTPAAMRASSGRWAGRWRMPDLGDRPETRPVGQPRALTACRMGCRPQPAQDQSAG